MINLFKVKNPQLQRAIAFRRLDRSTIIALANSYYFPVNLIDCMDDFLESKLLEILMIHGGKPFTIQAAPAFCNSTDELKIQIRVLPRDTVIQFTDEFMSEYFDRIATGMNQKQLKFYENLFAKLS